MSHGLESPGDEARDPDLEPTLFRSEQERDTRLASEGRRALRRLDRRAVRSGRLSPLAYPLTISHEKRFIWYRVAKAATRTVLYHLEEHAVPLDVRHVMRMRYPTDAFADYASFTVVRHPLTRFVSAWRNKVVESNYYKFDERTLVQMQDLASFTSWVGEQDLADLESTDQHLVLESRLVDLTQVDMVGRVERFDVDFPRICRFIGVPPPAAEPRRLNASEGRQPEVSDAVASRVAQLYRRDFEIFGYDQL